MATIEKEIQHTTRKRIGKRNEEKYRKIHAAYRETLTAMNAMLHYWQQAFPDVGMVEFFDFIKDPNRNPDIYLIARYADIIKDEHPGFNSIELIRSKIVPLPNEIHQLISLFPSIKVALSQVYDAGFIFPLANLFDSAENHFDTNESFDTMADEFSSRYTETPEQLAILESLEVIANGLNQLANLGQWNPHNANTSLFIGRKLSHFFHLDKTDVREPIQVEANIFQSENFKKKLGQFSEKFSNDRSDLFNFHYNKFKKYKKN